MTLFQYKGGTLICLSILVLIKATTPICNRAPDGTGVGKSPSDGRFRIRIAGNPNLYTAGETYTVSIAGIRSMQVPHKFSGFMLAAEPEVIQSGPNIGNIPNTGEFKLMGNALTRISDKCSNVVTQTSTLPKSEIEVLWTAPPSGSGCIAFRATVIEHRDVWYMDDGPLSKVLCEDEQDIIDNQPLLVDRCCACDEAKYEVIFEGLWSRHTHPKDFPTNSWLTRFSDIIGASHTPDYRFWEYGKLASEGLRQVAEHGSTRKLESELKDQSAQIRTIIKARGISYPNVTGKTFAVFRVDSNHHLVSLVSMIDPSPDWIVGVSGFELCLENCSWVEYKVHNLYPWDAGTDSGPTYISPDQPTYPRVPIKRIRTKDPNDPRSPFYDISGAEMKPLARLYISRQRLYEKNCESSSNEDDPNACETLPWSEWSDCNVKCGKGKRHRQREYKDSVLAHRMSCKRKLTQRETCYGTSTDCETVQEETNEGSNENPELTEGFQPECALTTFSEWSSCSATCGKGTRTKTRKYVNRKAKKKCEAGTSNKPPLEINEECFGTECTGEISETNSLDEHPECRTSKWSSWTPCSVTCGNGTQMRQRRVNRKQQPQQEDGDNFAREEDPCENVKKEETVICSVQQSCEITEPPDFCNFRPKVGHCRKLTTNRWYFEPNVQDCAVFPYSGCGGNGNNFMSREKCLETCKIEDTFNNLSIENLRYESIYDKVDCKVSDWIVRSCNVTCGEGHQIKTRKVLRSPRGSGKLCPKRLVRVDKCYVPCSDAEYPVPEQNSRLQWYGKRQRNSKNGEQDDCQYSNWSPWSPCTATCGTYVARQRTRVIFNQQQLHKCVDRVQMERCNVPECSEDDD